MKLTIITHPNSKNPRIEKSLLGVLHVYVKEVPLEGKATKAVIEALATHLKVKKRQVILLRGEKSKNKIFEIIEYR